MKIGNKYKLVYLDGKYTKFATGELILEDEFFIEIADKKDGNIGVGKSSIVKYTDLGLENGRQR